MVKVTLPDATDATSDTVPVMEVPPTPTTTLEMVTPAAVVVTVAPVRLVPLMVNPVEVPAVTVAPAASVVLVTVGPAGGEDDFLQDCTTMAAATKIIPARARIFKLPDTIFIAFNLMIKNCFVIVNIKGRPSCLMEHKRVFGHGFYEDPCFHIFLISIQGFGEGIPR
jgi:hypothetical protein